MKSIHKPIRLGRGFTPLFVTVCLSKKAWAKATATLDDAPEYPGHLDGSATHFTGVNGNAPCSIVTISRRMQKEADAALIIGLLCHEMIHAKQFCEKEMSTQFDNETEPYYVQHLTNAAWDEINKALKII